jgi:hypothetical protein
MGEPMQSPVPYGPRLTGMPAGAGPVAFHSSLRFISVSDKHLTDVHDDIVHDILTLGSEL